MDVTCHTQAANGVRYGCQMSYTHMLAMVSDVDAICHTHTGNDDNVDVTCHTHAGNAVRWGCHMSQDMALL